MARLARVVALDMPHHIVQRGNRRQNVFFREQDKQVYLDFLREESKRFLLDIWAYCLMDNHVHIIAVPKHKDSLARGIGQTHCAYTRMINFREGWRGYLWQGRFSSFLLNERYLFAAVRYVERNPVRSGIVKKAESYPWSSALTHVKKREDLLLTKFYLLDEIKDWSRYLSQEENEEDLKLFRRHGQTGKPLGDKTFIAYLERKLGVEFRRRKPGPKPRQSHN
ncbi:MAG: transposase [Candidatus Omnitrophica bacterium]|nr:transposase [Candidatus Omnitrophota bacterium]